ncbi:GNAT family N-acetyltransferase [Streptomyces flavalbus]|uniref:GNAT family N-acetyltransferase n=1 Tax=Streptomyces flavalbus TaxID=2665155 RepID=A0ABW2WA12_9ACTN
MDPVRLTTPRLILRTVDSDDTDAVYAAAQDPDIQRWTTVPSPYLHEHAESFTRQLVPEGWANDTMFTFGVFLPHGPLTGMIGVTMRSLGVAEIGFWATKEHRGHGYTTEATVAAARWAFTHLAVDRMEWRAEVGNHASRAVARNAGFTLEGTLRSALNSRGTRRDSWLASLLPSDLNLPSTSPYLPAPTT